MNRERILSLLADSKPVLAARYGVTRLALFGSAARDAARPDSDVDVLVSFEGSANSTRYFGVQFYLEDLLGRPVDLVTETALRNLELIGDAATGIPDDVRQSYPRIPWPMIIATRSRLIHGCLGIDNETLWSIVRRQFDRPHPPASHFADRCSFFRVGHHDRSDRVVRFDNDQGHLFLPRLHIDVSDRSLQTPYLGMKR